MPLTFDMTLTCDSCGRADGRATGKIHNGWLVVRTAPVERVLECVAETVLCDSRGGG